MKTAAPRCAALLLTLVSGFASADPTIEFLPPGYVLTGLSTGGLAGTGNVVGDASFETFRWTPEGGAVRLGGATVPVLGIGAGTPGISYDGQAISATILSVDNKMTQGIWRLGSGWAETMPPAPANGLIFDNAYGSAWGLSGNGQTLTGFYWGVVDGFTEARASAWSALTGVVNLDHQNNKGARINAASYDGSVLVGWEEGPQGPWRPTAWRNGVKILLSNTVATCEALDVNTDGSVIVGQTYNEETSLRVPAIWRWNGASYDMEVLNALPGTSPNQGMANLAGVSGDGTMAVGANRYQVSTNGPFDGLVWTASGGLVNAVDFIASLGLSSQIPPTMDIRTVTVISPDGSAIAGLGVDGGQQYSFIIRLAPPPCFGDADGDRDIDFADITSVLTNFGHFGAPFAPGDADGSTQVNFADITAVLTNFGIPCP